MTATSATTIAALLAISITGGHSPFAVASSAQQPVANEVAGETATPDTAAIDPSAAPSPTPGATAQPPTDSRTAPPNPVGTTPPRTSGGSGRAGSGATAPTQAPTARPRPTQAPGPVATATPGPNPTSTPPAQQAGMLSVTDGDAGPRLSWTQCTAPNFAAYAVVRSLDSEIHYPPEDYDTVVALVTSAGATSLTDSGAPNSKVYYAVWCLSRVDGESKTIWKTPTVVYAP